MRKTILLAVLLLLPPTTLVVVSAATRFPRRFAEVSPGHLYRGAYPSAAQVRRLVDEFHIHTIVNLNSATRDDWKLESLAAVDELGLQFCRIPLPGDGLGEFRDLDQAADALAAPDNRPIFLHCTAGKQRSNAVLAAYRIKHCRWTPDQAIAELVDAHGLDRVEEKALCDHIVAYAEHVRQDLANEEPGS